MLDFERLREDNDFLEPARPPIGVERVIINGQVAYEEGESAGRRGRKTHRAQE